MQLLHFQFMPPSTQHGFAKHDGQRTGPHYEVFHSTDCLILSRLALFGLTWQSRTPPVQRDPHRGQVAAGTLLPGSA